MKNVVSLLLAVAMGALMMSCTPEFSQMAEYKDITIVFGLLDISQDTQYVKIQKAFVTDGNAYEEAKNPDNLYYYDKIDVSLKEIVNQRERRSIPLYMTTDIPKNEGVFANPGQVLYYTAEKLSDEAQYKLVIVNKETGKVIEGQTAVVGNFDIMAPMSSQLNFTANKSVIKFYSAKNAAAYDIYMQFHYIEVDKETKKVVTPNGLIRWKIGEMDKQASSTALTNYFPNQFYSIVAANLDPDPNLIRYAVGECIDLEICAAEENYKIYLDVNAPSSSIVQDKLEFTNLETADGTVYGIFSSRNSIKRSYSLHQYAEDSLMYGSETKNLGFRRYGIN